jgi:hypothetical protein
VHPVAFATKADNCRVPERNGQKLYVPVERETVPVTTERQKKRAPRGQDELMQVDDTKHKVYIHNIDDELSSSESEAEEGKIVFLPDIERHLRANRIPAMVKANPEGELAGVNLADMQLVLYNVPTSLTVEPEKDSVRKAIIEARQRAREKQKTEYPQEKEVDMNDQPFPTAHQWIPSTTQPVNGIPEEDDPDAMDLS